MIKPSDATGQPGATSVAVAVAASAEIRVGSTDLTLVFDPRMLRAVGTESPLEGFMSEIDNTGGRVLTASATGGPGQDLPAGGTLFTVTFAVEPTAPAGCSSLTVEDRDRVEPDDLAGPVPPIPPLSIAYDTGPGRFCVTGWGFCQDRDKCTLDGCNSEGVCEPVELVPTEPAGVTCSLENLRGILASPPQPTCRNRCPQKLDLRLAKIERLIGQGVASAKVRGCRRKLRAAAQDAKQLAQWIARWSRRGRFAPAGRGETLANEAKRLRHKVARLFAREFCAHR